ncbi:nuclear transport factor 2 family protein [Nocardia brasiliensis]|uniref:nuclear transport factor 2 family protein n=1 Tax=Nocardia brasiliensis TaxID=37326 RepID=UPI002454AA14|nr:nuclear transport factor 2 family protein [Nocardia brasiliensis]
MVDVQQRLHAFLDKAELVELFDRYVHHLDFDRDNDAWLGAVFTDDAELVFPQGTFRGMAELREFQRMAYEKFPRSHHLGGNHRVVCDGDTATVTAHLTAVHIGPAAGPAGHTSFGGFGTAAAVRTAAGWRMRRFTFTSAWSVP